MRRALMRSVEFDGQLEALRGPGLDAHRIEILSRMERRVDLGHPAADPLQKLGEIFLLFLLIGIEDPLGEIQRAPGTDGFLLGHPPGVHLLAQRGQHDELRARAGFRRRRFRAAAPADRSHLRISATASLTASAQSMQRLHVAPERGSGRVGGGGSSRSTDPARS